MGADNVLKLYNTMQVREATRGTKMNEIMLLFTIATIIYLPPTFVAVSILKTHLIIAVLIVDNIQTFMALDLFEVTDRREFWKVFVTASAVTYTLAAIGLFAIYRKGLFDLLRAWAQALFWTQGSLSSRGQTTFVERERKQRQKEDIGWMQRARHRRTPLRRPIIANSNKTETGEGHTARGQYPEGSRQSQATFINQRLWRSEEEASHIEARLHESPTLSSRRNASPDIQVTGSPIATGGSRTGIHAMPNFTTELAKELRNL